MIIVLILRYTYIYIYIYIYIYKYKVTFFKFSNLKKNFYYKIIQVTNAIELEIEDTSLICYDLKLNVCPSLFPFF